MSETLEETVAKLKACGPLITDAAREELARRIHSLVAWTGAPGKYVYHCRRYGETHHYAHDTLEEALLDAYWESETAVAYGLCITKDGELVVGGDLSLRSIEYAERE